MVVGVMAGSMTTLFFSRSEVAAAEQWRSGQITISYDLGRGVWGIASAAGTERLEGNVAVVRFRNRQVRADQPCRRELSKETGRDRLGEYQRFKVTHRGLPWLEELVWSLTLRPESSYAVVRVSAKLSGDATEPVQFIELLNASQKGVRFGTSPAKWMRFLDRGSQGAHDVTPFFTAEKARHHTGSTLAIDDPVARRAILLGWLSWRGSNPTMIVSGTKAAGLDRVTAQCGYLQTNVQPSVVTEPLWISFQQHAVHGLERYAREVQAANNPPIRRDTMLGWLSWYCFRLKMTEQSVLDNARVIADKFRVYGIDTMQIDHGWQYRDIVGNWVANDRFPHGMKWLGDELQKRGLKLGVWMAVSQVSEFAPFFQQHPDAVIHLSDGQPWVCNKHWSWPPYGRTFNLDPTNPVAREHYRQSLRGLMDAGCRYYKVDFIGSSANTAVQFHDSASPRGGPMARGEMQQIRDAIGPDSWLRYCSSPSNVYCGIVNIGGATSDIGNPVGNWKWLSQYHQQLGTAWYKHRRFWHNEPDALMVGQGTENEARVRCAWLVLSGGVVALGDDLTQIAPERMALIPKCLPPYDVAARPLDLFENVPARIWDLHVTVGWDDYHVIGLFNFDPQEQTIHVPLNRLGMAAGDCLAWEFWKQTPVTPHQRELAVTVPGRDCRIVAVRRSVGRPQVLGTDMHLTMGGVELSDVRWDEVRRTLSGTAHRAPGADGKVFLQVPRGWRVEEGALAEDEQVAVVRIHFSDKANTWQARFRKDQL